MNNIAHHMPSSRTLLTLAILACLSGQAFAEDKSTDEANSWTLDRIVVTGTRESLHAPNTATATRTPTPVEEVPQSIQTLTRTLLEEQELQTVSDALVNVSGVAPSRTMETVLQSPLIRGFSVNYYFDGMPTYALPSAGADPATLVNVERIDVAKGPSSTLYGGGTGAPLSGLLNIVSKDPLPSFKASAALRGGSFGTLGAEADLNVGSEDSAVAFRINGMYETADSHIDLIDSRRHAVFPTLAWNISDNTRLVVRGQFNRLEQREYAGLPAELTVSPGLSIDRDVFAGAENAPRTSVENRMLTASLDHRFGDGSVLTAALRRYDGRVREYSTFPLLPLGGTLYAFGSGYVPSDADQTFATVSLLHTFEGATVDHRVLFGVDADRTDYRGEMGLDFGWGLVDYADRATNAPFGAAPALTELQDDHMRSLAAFAQDQISIGEKLDITAGLRWTQLDVRSRYTSSGFPFSDDDSRYRRFTPRLGLTYALSDKLSLFAGHARGFRGVVAAFGVSDPVPETSIANEAGLKFVDTIPGLTGSLSIYDIKRRNVVTPDPANIGFSIQTGEQRARGFETDLVYEPTDALSLLFNYAYTDAEVSKDNRLPEGDTLSRVPQHAGRIAGRYRFREGGLRGLEVGLGLSAVSSRELTLPNSVSVGGRALLDAQVAYAFPRATVSLSVANLLDRKGFEPYQYLGGAYVVPTVPRSAFLTIRTSF